MIDNDDHNTKSYLEFKTLALQLANDFKDDTLNHQVVAIWTKGTRVLGYGVNQRRYSKLSSYFYNSLHAEADLIRRYGNALKGAKIFIYRFNNAIGSPFVAEALCSKPCLLCGHLLSELGVGRVVCVDTDGRIVGLKVNELPTLCGNPVMITRQFLDRNCPDHHGKFVASQYLEIK